MTKINRTMIDFFFDLTKAIFVDGRKQVPPPPELSVKGEHRKRPIDMTQVANHGEVWTKVEDDKLPVGAVDEWRNVTSDLDKTKRQAGRTSRFTQYDKRVLSLPEFAGLDVVKYKVLKLVWADGVSNRKAGKHDSIKKLEKFKYSTRKAYYKALNMAHSLEQDTLSSVK